MKISFDFDDTLTHIDVQNCARKLMSDGHTIYILTARYGDNESNSWGADWNDDLKELAPDPANKINVEGMIKKLKDRKDVN